MAVSEISELKIIPHRFTAKFHDENIVGERLRKRQPDRPDSHTSLLPGPEYEETTNNQTKEGQRTMNMTIGTTDIRPSGMQGFFKPGEHFDHLRTVVLPDKSRKPLRVWFAGCSTGESAYSLGMLIDDHLGGSREWEMIASDPDVEKLEIAKLGQYDWDEMESVPAPYREAYFRMVSRGRSKNRFVIKQQLRRRIFFVHMNINRMLPPFEPFDVIVVRQSPDAGSAMGSVEHLVPLLASGGCMLLENVRTPSSPVLMELDDGFLVRTYESSAEYLLPPLQARSAFPTTPSQRARLYGACSEM